MVGSVSLWRRLLASRHCTFCAAGGSRGGPIRLRKHAKTRENMRCRTHTPLKPQRPALLHRGPLLDLGGGGAAAEAVLPLHRCSPPPPPPSIAHQRACAGVGALARGAGRWTGHTAKGRWGSGGQGVPADLPSSVPRPKGRGEDRRGGSVVLGQCPDGGTGGLPCAVQSRYRPLALDQTRHSRLAGELDLSRTWTRGRPPANV